MSARAIACALSMLALSAGCSLVKLSEDIVIERCDSHSDCAGLNDPEAASFPCEQWQCNEDSGRCELGPTDLDGDGQSPATVDGVECDVPEDEADCDDDTDEVAIGAAEQCDGQDNDCDGQVDEGVLGRGPVRRLVTFDNGELGAATSASYARDPNSGALAIAYGMDSQQAGLSVLDSPEATASNDDLKVNGSATSAPTGEVVVTPLDGDAFAVAFVDGDGGAHLVAGLVERGSDSATVEADIAGGGLACIPDGDCGGPEATRLALAGTGIDVALAYLETDAAPTCGAPDPDGDPVLRATALFAVGGSLTAREGAPVELGPSADGAPAGLLAIGELGERRARETGWLIAYVDAAGNLRVGHLQLDADNELVVGADALLTRDAAGGARGSPALAFGPDTQEGRWLALTHRVDCGRDGRILLDLFLVELDDDGGLVLTEQASDIEVGGDAPGERAPALAYSEVLDAWAVSYLDSRGLRARVLSRDGTLRGESPYELLRDEADDSLRTLLTPGLVPLGEEAWFGVLAHVQRQSEDVPRAFEMFTLGCDLPGR